MEFALAVNSLGEITEVKLCHPRDALSTGQSMMNIFLEENGLQIMQMVRDASSFGQYAHRQLYLRQERDPVTVHVLVGDDELLVIGFSQEYSTDELVKVYNELMNHLRFEFKRSVQQREQSVQEQFEQIQALNNELTNSKRSLAKANGELQRQFRFERLLSDISARLARCDSQTRPNVINEVLLLWGEFFDADHLHVFVFEHKESSSPYCYQWNAPGAPLFSQEEKCICACDAWLRAELGRGEPLVLSEFANLPPESDSITRIWKRQGIESLLLPFMDGNTLAGYVCMSFVKRKYKWLNSAVSFCRIVAEVVGYAVGKQQAEDKLSEYTTELERQSVEVDRLYSVLDTEMQNARVAHQRLVQQRRDHV